MKITQVKVYPYTKKKTNGEVGIGQVVLDDMILLTGLKLIERNGKQFVLYPVNYKNKRQLCFVQPIKKVIADEISDALFRSYEEVKINAEALSVNIDNIDSAFMDGIQDMMNVFQNEQNMNTAAMVLKNGPESNGPDPMDEE